MLPAHYLCHLSTASAAALAFTQSALSQMHLLQSPMRMPILHHSLPRHRIMSIPCFLTLGHFPLRLALHSLPLPPSDCYIPSITLLLRTGLTSILPTFPHCPPK